MIRSANTNEMTPPKLIPPFQSTAASGTLPIEQTNETTETAGPTSGPHTFDQTVWSVRNTSRSQDSGTQAANAPAMSSPPAMSRQTAAQSMAKYPAAGRLHDAVPDEHPECHRQQQDHQRPADELGEREPPAQQERHDDAQLDDEVGGGDLEGHRGGEVRSLPDQRPGQRHRGVRAGAGRGAQPGRDGQAAGPIVRHQPDDLLPAYYRLHHRGQEETEDQRPQDLPAHRPGDRQRVTQGVQDGHRGHLLGPRKQSSTAATIPG